MQSNKALKKIIFEYKMKGVTKSNGVCIPSNFAKAQAQNIP